MTDQEKVALVWLRTYPRPGSQWEEYVHQHDTKMLVAFAEFHLKRHQEKVNSPFLALEKYLDEHPVQAKEAWDKVAQKADDDFAAFKETLTPEARQEILEDNADHTLRKHFHSGPTLEELDQMFLENMVRQVYQENKKLRDLIETQNVQINPSVNNTKS